MVQSYLFYGNLNNFKLEELKENWAFVGFLVLRVVTHKHFSPYEGDHSYDHGCLRFAYTFHFHTSILTVLATNWNNAGIKRLYNMESGEKESKKITGQERMEGNEHVKSRNEWSREREQASTCWWDSLIYNQEYSVLKEKDCTVC